jgi:choline dehydrogenase-like flavoprotein
MIRRARSGGLTTADYDVCIVGGGAAGITLALELADRGRRVCLLEAGGESYAPVAQGYLEGDVAGDRYPPLRSTRMSVLGGSTQVWAGWCRPLEPADFEPRPDLDGPGWPFTRDALLPYYERAHAVCGLAEFEYDPALWADRLGLEPLLGDGELSHAMFHVRALQFGVAQRARLAAAPGLDVFLHAPVTGLEVDAGGAVQGVRVRPEDGGQAVVRAGDYVVAAGGIENARLLLISAPDPARAPGNQHDLVGRFFTDHPFINPGWLVLDHGPRRLDLYFPRPAPNRVPPARDGGALVRATLTLPRHVMERERLPGSALFFHPRYEAHAAFDSRATRSFLELRDSLRSRAVPGSAWTLLRRAATGPHHVAVAVARKLLVRDAPAARWRLRMMFETASRYGNRVELGPERDSLGRPRARVTWRVADHELDAMRRSLAAYDEAFRRAGVGRIEPTLREASAWRHALEGGKHHMGTTRMHTDPSRGVVDADCRVHGTHNLYIAGSSVFPNTGYANPTLTIVALALRLADHLARIRPGSR